MNKLELIRLLAKAYNNLDIKEIEEILSEEIIYESQNVLKPICGKNELKTYLSAKFELIKNTKNTVFAEIGFLGEEDRSNFNDLSNYKGQPCIILSQGEKENKGALILIEAANNKILRIDICTIAPHWTLANRTNQYPS